jgi:hypothetical protein
VLHPLDGHVSMVGHRVRAAVRGAGRL